jgi:hypothetical protein
MISSHPSLILALNFILLGFYRYMLKLNKIA